MRWLDCWNFIAIAFIILCILAACVLSVSVNDSTLLSVLRLMELVIVLSLTSIVLVRSFIALVKRFSLTKGDVALMLLMTCAFWAITSLTGACASRMAVGFGADPSILPLCDMKSTLRPRMYEDLFNHSV